jgi:hypothetical protein
MAVFELTGGSHVHKDGKLYRKGDLITSDVDLTRAFGMRNKFKLIEPDPVNPGVLTTQLPPKPPEPEALVVAICPDRDVLGDNVTPRWPTASEAGCEVRRRGSFYHVFKLPSVKPLNERGLRAKQVEQFLVSTCSG